VAFVRGRSRQKRTGHAGTLDPFATGVLPVALGRATRVIEYLMDARKIYRATVRLGVETDSYDRTGAVIAEAGVSAVSRAEVERAIERFEGEIDQRPPAYSALKRDGVPLYKLARAGMPVAAPPRRVIVYRIEMTSWAPPLFGFEVECGRGTYVRSLAHDIGALLGCGASLDALQRTRVGPFRIEDAAGIETLRAEFGSGQWQHRLLGLDEVLLEWPAAILGADNERRLRTGQPAIVAKDAALNEPTKSTARHKLIEGRARAYGSEGDFIGVIRPEGDSSWRAVKVL
jgi:tRNA pseudouridine55 synthase